MSASWTCARANSWCTKLKGTWQCGGFSGVFAEIGSSWVPYTTFRAVSILASNSRRYSYLKNNSPYRWVGESTTPHITDTRSGRLPTSPIRRVGYWIFFKENCLYRWYRESLTPRSNDTVSRRIPVSLSQRVTDSAYHRYGESTALCIGDTGSRRLRVSVIRGVAIWRKKISLTSIFSTLNC